MDSEIKIRPFKLPLERLFKVGKTRKIVKKRLLTALAESGMLTKACKKAGVTTGSHYYWLQTDPDYVAAYDLVTQIQNTVLKEEIWNRAVNGHKRPVIYKGEIVSYYMEKSDELLKFEAQARMAEYKSNNININVSSPKSFTIGSEPLDLSEVKQLDK